MIAHDTMLTFAILLVFAGCIFALLAISQPDGDTSHYDKGYSDGYNALPHDRAYLARLNDDQKRDYYEGRRTGWNQHVVDMLRKKAGEGRL